MQGFYKQAGALALGWPFRICSPRATTIRLICLAQTQAAHEATTIRLDSKSGILFHSSDLLLSADYEIQILSSETKSFETIRYLSGRPVTNLQSF